MDESARTTVIVSPRERYSPIVESLESLFSTISPDVPVIVVGKYPASVQTKLRELSRTRPFRHETRDWPLLPNQARNIGTDFVETEYVAFCDNEIIYEPGWLEALEGHAERTGVEVVAPLICIGPPRASVIHHAGGPITVTVDKRGMHLGDKHNLIDRPINELKTCKLPEITDAAEFHVMFVRTDFMRQVGPLDERLMTREHLDFALRVKHAGGRIGFEPRSIVTHNAWGKLEPGDLSYHVFRWNHEDAAHSLDVFENTWGVFLDRGAILDGWIRHHRRARIQEQYAWVQPLAGTRILKRLVMPWVEWRLLRQIHRPAQRRLPREIPTAERNALLAELTARTDLAANSDRSPATLATESPVTAS